MSVATSSYAAHPYGAAAPPHAHTRRASTAASRRSSMPPPPRDPLPPVPTLPGYAPAQTYGLPPADYGYGASTANLHGAQLPAYSRRDRPGADTRAAKASRTAQWVAGGSAPEAAPAGSLAAFGYAIDIGGAPPGYEDERARRDEHEGVIGMSAKRQLASDGKSSRSKASASPPNSAAKAAKSVLRIFGSGKGSPEPYAPLGDGDSVLNARR